MKPMYPISQHAYNMQALAEREQQHRVCQERDLSTFRIEGKLTRFEGPFLATRQYLSPQSR